MSSLPDPDTNAPHSASAEAPPQEPISASPRRKRRSFRAALASLLGIAAGLGIAEMAFRARDGGAFPLVNVYERDEARGVRLRPGSVTRVGRRGERAIEVRINHDGYRGPEWPAPTRGEVVVVGDSLSFGLGVDEKEALAARLADKLPGGAPVLDASVPTYGPPEYLATMEQVLARRTPQTVVLVLNPINDFTEIDRPNKERHAAVDGWAARITKGGEAPSSSPLREAAIQRSHAAFALWRWQRMREIDARPAPPERPFEDLLRAAANVEHAARVESGWRHAIEEQDAARKAAEDELAAARRHIVSLVRTYLPYESYASPYGREREAYLRADGDPEDQTFELRYGGCAAIGRRGPLDYRARFSGSRIREEVEGVLRRLARAGTLPREKAESIEAAFARRDAALERMRALVLAPPHPPTATRPPLPIDPAIARAQEIASARGAKLVVAIAPLDAQVSDEAREQRGLSREEIASIDVLLADVANGARAIGAVGVDATLALKKLGSTAFLEDGHLSAAGHEALAGAIAESLAARAD
jgi:lysophospholipase L1-like esterase